jgi:hypothetical protein
MVDEGDNQPVVFQFPTKETEEKMRMKYINHCPSHFHGLISKDPNTILFGFEVLCKTYDYKTDAQKIKL